jgi:hypothetical protein
MALVFFDLGDAVAAEYWSGVALKINPRGPATKLVVALLHLYHHEETAAVEVARELVQPDAWTRGVRGYALRIAEAPSLAAGNYEEVISDYLLAYPELEEGNLPMVTTDIMDACVVALDLASIYLQQGKQAKANTLLLAVESEMRHWKPRAASWRRGYGYANVDLHALRGEREQALSVLRKNAAMGIRDFWRLQLLYNPNLESIRDTPEFAAVIAEIEADMAEQLERVREMERNGELEPIPEISATTH